MREILGQAARFGAIGILATVIHAIIYGSFARVGATSPQIANLSAFIIAFGFSYWGHSRFTFSGGNHRMGSTGPRFLAVALCGYALNSGFVFLTTEILGWPPTAALFFMLFVTPAAVFILSKYWAFRAGARKPTGF